MGRLALAAKITHVPSMYLRPRHALAGRRRGYRINCRPRFTGDCTSNELPHFIRFIRYDHPGNPDLGLLGRDACDQPAEVITLYFTSSGAGQVNAVLPI